MKIKQENVKSVQLTNGDVAHDLRTQKNDESMLIDAIVFNKLCSAIKSADFSEFMENIQRTIRVQEDRQAIINVMREAIVFEDFLDIIHGQGQVDPTVEI